MTRRSAWTATALMAAVLWGGPAAGQARQGLLSLAEGRIFYEALGSGDPIVVVHGGPGLDHNYLRPGLDVLSASHTVIYYDQRGTGRSDAPLDSAHINVDEFVSDIEALRQIFGYERITVLGHSFGGVVALAYALAHPDETAGLILMNTVEPGNRWAAETARRAANARSPADSAESAGLYASEALAARDPGTLSRMYRLAFRGLFRDPSKIDELNLHLSRRTAENGGTVAALLGGSVADLDWWGRLPSLDVPTLILHGRYDATPSAMARELADSIPDAELVVLDSGHFPFVEDAGRLVSALESFLQKVQR